MRAGLVAGKAQKSIEISDQDHIPYWVKTRDGLAFSDMKAAKGGRAPDFCIVGAAKCASTSINAMLSNHPGIFMNPLKEPHYYSTNVFYDHKRDWYFGLYADAKPGQLLGEASISYARYPIVGKDIPARMAADNPDMKIILNVREPVARLKSECIQEIKYRTYAMGETVEIKSLDSFLDDTENSPSEKTGKVEAGEYMNQLEQFLAYFPKENVTIVFYDDFRDDPHTFLKSITEFIGAAPPPQMDMARQNQADGVVDGIVAVNSIDRMDRIPFVRTFRQILPKSLRQRIRNLMTRKQASRYEFSPERIASLKAHYAPHNDRLRAFTGSSLNHWS